MGIIITVSLVYGLLWCYLLGHLLKNKTIYPVAGTPRLTQAFWVVTFLFFNPWLTLLYVVFGVSLRRKEEQPKHLKAVRFTAISLVLLVLVSFELPITTPRNIETRLNAKTEDQRRLIPDAHTIVLAPSKGTLNGGGSRGFKGINSLDMRHVAVVNHSDHPLAIKLAHTLQQMLLCHPRVETATYYPAHTRGKGGNAMPGIIFEINENSITTLPLPAGRSTNVDLSISIQTSQAITDRWTNLPLVPFKMEMTLKQTFSAFGPESPAKKFILESRSIIQIADQFFTNSSLFSWWDFDPSPNLPPYVYGSYIPAPRLPIPDHLIQSSLTGYDLFTHNLTFWYFHPKTSIKETLHLLRTNLQEDGWNPKGSQTNRIYMVRDQETFKVVAKRHLLVARYRNAFSEAEKNKVLESLLNDETISDQSLVFFGRTFRESATKSIRIDSFERMQKIQPKNLAEAIELAFLLEESGQKENALDMLKQAAAYEQALDSPQARWKIEELAERIGDASLPNRIPEDATLQKIGFIPFEKLNTGFSQHVRIEEPLRFYRESTEALSNGTTKKTIHYYTFRIVQPLFNRTTKTGKETSPLALVVTKTQPKGGNSLVLMTGSIKKKKWTSRNTLSFNASAPSYTKIYISILDNEILEFTASPDENPDSILVL